MQLVTQTELCGLRFDEEKAIRWICESGFDAIDYSMFHLKNEDCNLANDGYKEYVLGLKAIADSYGKPFNQAHAPFPSFKTKELDYNEFIFPRIVRSIEIAGILGVKNIVVHPTDFGVKSEENLERNADFYNKLAPYAKDSGVKIAVENMFGHDKRRGYIVPNICSMPDEFVKMMDMLDPEVFTACVDIGHAGLVGTTAPELIRSLGHYVGCLHVHDNEYKHDRHLPPYFCDLDWDEITQSLADINYEGAFTFEADMLFEKLPEDTIPYAFGLLHSIGRSLIKQIESKRKN